MAGFQSRQSLLERAPQRLTRSWLHLGLLRELIVVQTLRLCRQSHIIHARSRPPREPPWRPAHSRLFSPEAGRTDDGDEEEQDDAVR